jgi:hypothetical protein
MTVRFLLAAVPLAGLLAGCNLSDSPLRTATRAAVAPSWQAMATADDRQRLSGWRDAWTTAVDAVRAAGQGAVLDRDAALYDPDRALEKPLPPPGAYSCRWIKLGSAAPAVAAFTAYDAQPCHIVQAGSLTRFAMSGGAQRPQGVLFPDAPARGVFLGTLRFAEERGPIAYGRDTQRDMAGFVQRIGDRRWRLALPSPHFESQMDLIEITPAA